MSLAVKAGHSNINDSQGRSAANLCLAIKTRRANELNLAQNLIHLQALIFMAIADELSSPASSRKATWLGSAVTLANSLQLQRLKHTETTGSSDVYRLMRRAWLSLVVLDRWHAAAICSATLIHDENVQLVPSDHALLGSTSYHLLRKRLSSTGVVQH